MKTLLALTLSTIFLSPSAFSNINKQSQEHSDPEHLKAQLQEAKQKVQKDEQLIQKAEARKSESEGQVDVDKAEIKKYEAQKQEDEARVKKLEDSLKSKE